MVVDYDLAIVGNGEKADLLAMRAARLKARVVLVTDPNILDLEQIQACFAQLLRDSSEWQQTPIAGKTAFAAAIAHLKQELHPYNRLELLQASGVDAILGSGQFSDRATFTTFAPSQRQLRARAFAIVVDRLPTLRQIMGLNEIDYLTCEHLLQLDSVPKRLAVIGGGAIDCIVAQTLCRLGHDVTIFTDRTHILADLDVEIARILQAQLEIEGVNIYTATRITAVAKLDSFQDAYRRASDRTSYQLWAGEHTSRYEQILLPSWHANHKQSHNYNWANHLNLSQAGVALSSGTGEIRVNDKLQTTNRRIYICRQRTDIRTILANTLFLPTAKVAKQIVPDAIAMQPSSARVGMTEIEARLSYGQDLFVLQEAPQKADPEFCKLLCRRNGKIVGAHAVGSNASELIETVAIAMHAKLNVYQLGRMADASSGTITQLAAQLDRQIYSRSIGRQAWLEKWFNWRRQWNI